MNMGVPVFAVMMMLLVSARSSESENNQRATINLKGGPDDVVWIVQFSDLHFSVHQPERALDFKKLVGPALSMVNPSIVFITGDLTDGKSKDLLTMRQDEEEWKGYQHVMEDVVKTSGLNKSIFYDLRGNHDNFGVPAVGGPWDFFSKYSLNGNQRRKGHINSVTIQVHTKDNASDLLTKGLGKVLHWNCCALLGLAFFSDFLHKSVHSDANLLQHSSQMHLDSVASLQHASVAGGANNNNKLNVAFSILAKRGLMLCN